ncbi:hypothetical protein FA95DRAFT_1289514 [Auriscalpium vulgare]|uniref:Uncharacterized protein n=1 Tax=Auriscalpium vulgare TaxID=40419 RepID=A0ACB8RSS5_9AGAM|nr:hypothetical protein FA95DRAFT_1289514 [Auriscalpium vulgare]
MSLLVLPSELIVKIIIDADYRFLLNLQLVCRRLHGIVQDAVPFQHKIALAATGMRESAEAASAHSLATRVAMLKDYETAWRHAAWAEVAAIQDTPSKPSPAFHRVSSGIVAWLVRSGRGETGDKIYVTQTPSMLRGVEHRSWELKFEFGIVDFDIDASQDLLVLVHWVEDATLPGQSFTDLRTVSLTTGEDHPLAPTSHIPLGSRSSPVPESVGVCGDIITQHMYPPFSTTSSFVVWNWKSGEYRKATIRGHGPIHTFFLDDSHLARIDTSASASYGDEEVRLSVYNFRSVLQCPASTNATELPEVCSFRLPPSKEGTRLVGAAFLPNFAPASCAASVQQGAFFADSRSGRVCVIVLTTIAPRRTTVSERWELSFHVHSLLPFARLSALQGQRTADQASVPGPSVPWGEWGPQHAHLARRVQPTMPMWAYGLAIVRCLQIYGRFEVVVSDFHPRRVARKRTLGPPQPVDATLIAGENYQAVVDGAFPCAVATVGLPCEWPGTPATVLPSEDALLVHFGAMWHTGIRWNAQMRVLCLGPPADVVDAAHDNVKDPPLDI